jgi:tetratricopeptide (TPR) repeat protein
MDELEPGLKAQVDALINDAMTSFDPARIEPTIATLEQAWALLPAPPERWPDSFLIAKYLTHVTFNAGRFEDALPRAELFTRAFTKRAYGESEFMLGKVYFQLGRLDEAAACFATASEKSFDGKVGRVWTGEKDPRYLTFFAETPAGQAAATQKQLPRKR